MSNYAESAFCQKLQNKRVVPKGHLNAKNARELEKVLFDLLINRNQPIYTLFTLISNFNFWYFNVLKVIKLIKTLMCLMCFVVFASYTVDDKTI